MLNSQLFVSLNLIFAVVYAAPNNIEASPLFKRADIIEEKDKETFLSLTNQYRTLHGAENLTWNATLAAHAQEHCNSCQFKHVGYGTNANLMWMPVLSGTEERQFMVSNTIYYWYNQPKIKSRPSHFTALVWKKSRQLGCGYNLCKPVDENGYEYYLLACIYDPKVNVLGQLRYNVQV
jgi:uncharacterized protein YkwD